MTRESSRGVGLAILLGAFGLLLGTGLVQGRLREERAPEERQDLARLIQARRATIAELSREVDRLSDRVRRIEDEASAGSGAVRRLTAGVARLRDLTGLAPATGPGLVVELGDSDREPRTREELTDLRIQDVDLQMVVNALWAAGAEAVTINGRRVVATTAIRKAGSAILVNYRAVSSPYRVIALGDPAGLAARLGSSEIAERFAVWRDVYGLGYRVTKGDTLHAPALRGARELRFAQPVEEPA